MKVCQKWFHDSLIGPIPPLQDKLWCKRSGFKWPSTLSVVATSRPLTSSFPSHLPLEGSFPSLWDLRANLQIDAKTHSSSCRMGGGSLHTMNRELYMVRENRQLVTDKPVEFEKTPLGRFKTAGKLPIALKEFMDYTQISWRENRRMWTCNQPVGLANTRMSTGY